MSVLIVVGEEVIMVAGEPEGNYGSDPLQEKDFGKGPALVWEEVTSVFDKTTGSLLKFDKGML